VFIFKITIIKCYRLPIRDWIRKKKVILYLGLWEQLNNENFKGGEFTTFKNEAGRYDCGTYVICDIVFQRNIVAILSDG